MSYPPSKIPDAPMPLSMMPSVETFHDDDVVYVAQPQNPMGQRSRKATLKQLRDSQVMMPKMFITSTAPNFGPWEVDLTGCFPNTSIQLIRPAGRGDTTVDMVILKNAPADVLMTVEISVDYGVLTGSLLVHLEDTSNLLGTLRARFYDAAIGVFKNTTKESFCQLPGIVSNEYQDLLVFRNLEALNYKPRVDGLDILTGSSAAYTYEPEYNTAGEAASVPVHTIVNKRNTTVAVTFNGVTSSSTATSIKTIWLHYAESLVLIPIDTITGITGIAPGKYTPRFAYIGGHNTDPVA